MLFFNVEKGCYIMRKKILVVSKGFIHPSFFCRKRLKLLLKGLQDDFMFSFTNKLTDLEKVEGKSFDAVILYYHEKKISNRTLAAFKNFSEGGGGVLALHSAMASFKDNKEYQEILGGKFIGHGKVKKIDVFAKDKSHEILKGTTDFTVRDELYLHEYDNLNQIILNCRDNGQDEPMLWTKHYGYGRVCYFAPGHCVNVFRNREVKRVIENSLRWVCQVEVEDE